MAVEIADRIVEREAAAEDGVRFELHPGEGGRADVLDHRLVVAGPRRQPLHLLLHIAVFFQEDVAVEHPAPVEELVLQADLVVVDMLGVVGPGQVLLPARPLKPPLRKPREYWA